MIPFRIHTHYSIQKSFCHIDDLVSRAKELGLTSLCITDYNTLSGCVEFHTECTKNGIKPILGCFYNGYILLCKNRTGWNNLIKWTNHEDQCPDGLICILTKETSEYDLDLLLSIFKNDIFISNDAEGSLDLTVLHGNPVYYIHPDDQLYQQVIICSQHKKTIHDVPELISLHPEIDPAHNEYYLRTDTDPRNTTDILDQLVERFDISNPPNIPQQDNAHETIKQLCRNGWRSKQLLLVKTNPELYKEYTDRITQELSVFEEFGLSGYMLIIHDLVNYARSKGITVGLRGSASGCLISYLIDISDIDPLFPDPTLEFNKQRCLLFERFINKGRLSKDRISLPDCDLDIPPSFREDLIHYLETKYGHDHIGHIITLNRMDGKAVLKEVFRVLDPVSHSFDVSNIITSYMVDTARVQDELEDLKSDNPKYNIINYCIDHIPKIAQYYNEYKREFDIAIKLASTIKNHGKHAAGIVISSTPITQTFPCIVDEDTNRYIIALEMEDAEYCGAVKYDLLGVAALEKMDRIIEMVNNNLTTVTVNEIGDDTNVLGT